MAQYGRAQLGADAGKAKAEYIKTSEAARAGRDRAQGSRSLWKNIGKGVGFVAGALTGQPWMMAAGGSLFGGIADFANTAEDLEASGGKYAALLAGKDKAFNSALKKFDAQENMAAMIDVGKDLLQSYALSKAGGFDKMSQKFGELRAAGDPSLAAGAGELDNLADFQNGFGPGLDVSTEALNETINASLDAGLYKGMELGKPLARAFGKDIPTGEYAMEFKNAVNPFELMADEEVGW